MNTILMFITDNYIYFLVIILLIIITIIGFLSDKKKSNQKMEIKDEKPETPMDIPTFVHGNIKEEQKIIKKAKRCALYDLCNPKPNYTHLINAQQQLDKIMDPLYGVKSHDPIEREHALLYFYQSKTNLLSIL